MTIRTLLVTASFIAILSGCTARATVPRSQDYYESIQRASAPAATSTLFPNDSAALSDEDIKRILAYRYVPAPHNRIAVLDVGREYWFGFSDTLDRLGNEAQSGLIDKLRSSPIVYDASYLPSFLIPAQKTIPMFREAAARYQADLLLIYRSSCRTYEKFHLLSADKSKAYCNVEAVLLDVRTGIIPFTVVASRDYITEKKPEDINFRETMRKAQLEALGEALAEVGTSLTEFLEKSKQ